jgi:hypothetical protein
VAPLGSPRVLLLNETGRYAHLRVLPAADVRSPARLTITSALQLKLPTFVFGSALSVFASQPVNANSADQIPVYGTIHDTFLHTPYASEGMSGGWFAGAGETLASGAGFEETYLASYYQNPDQAANVITNIGSTMSLIGSPALCSSGSQCVQVDFTATDQSGNPFEGYYRIVVESNAILETEFDVGTSDYAAQKNTGLSYLDVVSNAFVNLFTQQPPTSTPLPTPIPTTPPPTTAPTPTPTPVPTQVQTSFTIVSVRVEKNNAAADYQLAKAPVTKIKSGSTVFLSIYVTVNSAPPNSTAVAEWVVTAGKKLLLDRNLSQNLGADPTVTGRFHLRAKLSGKGIFTVTGKVTINGQTQQSDTSIQVTKKKKHH